MKVQQGLEELFRGKGTIDKTRPILGAFIAVRHISSFVNGAKKKKTSVVPFLPFRSQSEFSRGRRFARFNGALRGGAAFRFGEQIVSECGQIVLVCRFQD